MNRQRKLLYLMTNHRNLVERNYKVLGLRPHPVDRAITNSGVKGKIIRHLVARAPGHKNMVYWSIGFRLIAGTW